MAHTTQQIVNWLETALTGYGGLPTPIVGEIRQFAELPGLSVIPSDEQLERDSMHGSSTRRLEINIRIAAYTFEDVTAHSVDIEKAISNASPLENVIPTLLSRSYDYDTEPERTIILCSHLFEFDHRTTDKDPETFI